MFRRGLLLLGIQLFISKCLASECKDGTLVLTLFGTRNYSGNWNLFYDFDRNFCNSTESWRLDFVQDWNSGRRIRLKGSYRERIPESELKYATPITFGENGRTETIVITRNQGHSLTENDHKYSLHSHKGGGADNNRVPVPEASIKPPLAPKQVEKFAARGPVASETDENMISKSPDTEQKSSDFVIVKGPTKKTEYNINTNKIGDSSQTQTMEIKLEEQPEEGLEAEAEERNSTVSGKSPAAQDGVQESLATDINQKTTQYNITTVRGNVKSCTGKEPPVESKMKVFTREEWNALDPRKEFDTFQNPAKFIFITQTNVICPDENVCSLTLRKMQKVLMDCFGDVYSNFYVDDGGRTYEGLGWRRMRSNDSIYVHFLTDGWKLPSSETFASFALLMWEGMRVQRISEDFQLVENKHLTRSFQEELRRWVQWSKRMLI